jgi:hypothetical protein
MHDVHRVPAPETTQPLPPSDDEDDVDIGGGSRFPSGHRTEEDGAHEPISPRAALGVTPELEQGLEAIGSRRHGRLDPSR